MIVRKLLPPGSTRRKAVKKILTKAGVLQHRGEYEVWAYENCDHIGLYPTVAGDGPEKSSGKISAKISVVVPAYNTPARYLYPMVHSVVGQTMQTGSLSW